jgi:hypothetical protein
MEENGDPKRHLAQSRKLQGSKPDLHRETDD